MSVVDKEDMAEYCLTPTDAEFCEKYDITAWELATFIRWSFLWSFRLFVEHNKIYLGDHIGFICAFDDAIDRSTDPFADEGLMAETILAWRGRGSRGSFIAEEDRVKHPILRRSDEDE